MYMSWCHSYAMVTGSVTLFTAPIDTAPSPAPHVITRCICCSSIHDIYSLLQRLCFGFSSVYSRSVNNGSLHTIKTKPSAGVPLRTALSQPMQETLPSVKLVVRASSGIDETRSSSHILDSSPNCFAGLSDFNDQFRALLPPSRVALCSAVDSYSDEIGNRATSPTPPLYSVTLSPLDCRCFEIHVGKCFRPRVGTLPPSPAAHLCLIFVTKQTMICCSEGCTIDDSVCSPTPAASPYVTAISGVPCIFRDGF
ncbi:hypothetical protein Bca101_082580 [Brassica carinata]